MFYFSNIKFEGVSKEKILNDNQDYFLVITVNAEIIVAINEDNKFKMISDQSICTIDGQVPYLLARRKYNELEKISGSEFVNDIFECCRLKDRKIFILGGDEQVNIDAVNNVRVGYGISVDGYSPPFSSYPFSSEVNNTIKELLAEFKPDYLLICFNALKTNYWAYDNEAFLREIGVRFSIGVGGTVDMLSGRLTRSPKLIQKLCLEGVFRLIQEPKLFRIKRIITSLKMFKYL